MQPQLNHYIRLDLTRLLTGRHKCATSQHISKAGAESKSSMSLPEGPSQNISGVIFPLDSLFSHLRLSRLLHGYLEQRSTSLAETLKLLAEVYETPLLLCWFKSYMISLMPALNESGNTTNMLLWERSSTCRSTIDAPNHSINIAGGNFYQERELLQFLGCLNLRMDGVELNASHQQYAQFSSENSGPWIFISCSCTSCPMSFPHA